jgi:hypothetical protein
MRNVPIGVAKLTREIRIFFVVSTGGGGLFEKEADR